MPSLDSGPTPAPPTAAAPMPPLAGPFAAFGAAAGFFAILALAFLRPAAREVSPLLPTLATAGIGAALGQVLRVWPRLHDPLAPREIVVAWIAVLTSLAGALSGGVVGFVTWGDSGVTRFAAGGIFVGLLFTPSCVVVFDAARRAGRGRHGSLVAATDRRTVLSTVLAGVAFAGATQVPTILALQPSSHLAMPTQVFASFVTCLGATVGIALLQRQDRATRAALDAFTKEASWLDRTTPQGDAESLPEGAVDLGLGEDHWTRTTDATYRRSGKADVLVKGSVKDANDAFEECERRRHRALLVATAGLTAVLAATLLRASVFA